jgi:hypothetical protein
MKNLWRPGRVHAQVGVCAGTKEVCACACCTWRCCGTCGDTVTLLGAVKQASLAPLPSCNQPTHSWVHTHTGSLVLSPQHCDHVCVCVCFWACCWLQGHYCMMVVGVAAWCMPVRSAVTSRPWRVTKLEGGGPLGSTTCLPRHAWLCHRHGSPQCTRARIVGSCLAGGAFGEDLL